MMAAPLRASRAAIAHHYDVSNDFYALWLDPTRAYSCALWAEGDDLHRAQVRKLDYHIDQARAEGVNRLLDVGCGWGGLLKQAVTRRGVHQAVGLTLSSDQRDFIRGFGLSNIDVLLQDWGSYHPTDTFDALISVGAFGHVARYGIPHEQKLGAYRAFFEVSHKLLAPGAWLSLQTMAYGDLPPKKVFSDLFIAKEIFPESDFPRLSEIAEACDGLFEIKLVRNDREDYARTYREWFTRLRERRDEAVQIVGEPVVSRYERYLRTFSYSFELGAFTLLRITMKRIDRTRH